MKLNSKIPYLQVKRLKINKYDLKSLQDTYSKIAAKELYKSKVHVNKTRKDIKLLVICSEIPPHRDPASCGNRSVEFRKNSNNWFPQNARQYSRESQKRLQ